MPDGNAALQAAARATTTEQGPMDENPTLSPAPQAGTTWAALRNHRFYGAALGYLVVAWIVLQVAAIVLPGFGAPAWVLRALMIVLALGLGATLLVVWGKQRRASGMPLVPRTQHTRLLWVLTALLPAALVTAFFLIHPLARPLALAPTIAPAQSAPATPEKSVAVLPFANLSADKDNAFFADGVQDEVLTDLSKVADLKVISRTSVMQFKDTGSRNLPDIGKALGVAFVVEGSVQRAGNKIRVTAQLIDARTDGHKWAEHYDRDLADVFAIQSEIAQAIAAQLQAAISPQAHAAIEEAPTHDLQAYELYLRAREMFSSSPHNDPRAWLDGMVSLLTEATQRDPDFARAYAFLAEVQGLIYTRLDQTPGRAAMMREAVETVARLRPGSADAHEAMGMYAFLIDNDFVRAHDELAQTVRLAPNNAKSFHLLACIDRFQALWDDSIAHFRKALELDPEDEAAPFDYIQTLEGLRRYPDAMSVLDHLAANHPRDAALPMSVQVGKARILLAWKADARGALAIVAALPASYDPFGAVTRRRLFFNDCARDFAAADRALAAYPLPELGTDPRVLWEGYNARYRGDKAAAEKAFLAARPLLAAKVNSTPADADSLMTLATIDAAVGRKTEAKSEARRAAAMHPLEKDAWLGPGYAESLAIVLAWVDEREEAIRLVQTLCAHPNGPTYGYLKLHPDWDPLRGDPRFEAAVASLAPKP